MTTPNQAPDHRRKWDTDEYEQLHRKRLKEEAGEDSEEDDDETPKKRELLKQRDYRVDLDSRLGKSVVITKNTPASQAGGYFCDICVCVVKDSINFLDHINGKKHQRNLGMSMKIERSSLDQVKQRFEKVKQKKEEEKKKYDFEKRVTEIQEEEEKFREQRKERRQKKKRKHKEIEESAAGEADGDLDPDMAAMMGFSGFGTSKK